MKRALFTSNRGLFAFSIGMILLIIMVNFVLIEKSFSEKINETKNILIDGENASKERTLLENNFDRVIEEKLLEQIKLKNYNNGLAKKIISKEIEEKFPEIEQTSIFDAELNEDEQDAESKKNKIKIDSDFLEETSEVILIETDEGTYAEYTFTSTKMKDKIMQKRFGKKSIILFKVPIGYSVKKFFPLNLIELELIK